MSSNITCYTLNGAAQGIPLSTDYSCLPHYYCPNVTSSNPISIPTMCPPSLDCQISRLFGDACSPQGPFEPTVCPVKYYCPDYRTKILCPEGHYWYVNNLVLFQISH